MTNTLLLKLRGSHVPAMKNSKMIVRRGKKPMLITKPERRLWMDETIQDFVSQLRAAIPITENATLMEAARLSLIASLPQDDSWQWIPELIVRAEKCDKGNEGADILIEEMP